MTIKSPFVMNFYQLKEALFEECLCPIEWNVTDRLEDFAIEMQHLWIQIASKHQVDLEGEIWADPDSLESHIVEDSQQDVDNMRSDLINVRSWIEIARNEYIENTRRFWAMRIATHEEYSKHYPAPAITRDELLARTLQTDISLLYHGIDTQILQEVLWSGLCDIAMEKEEELWNKMLVVSNLRIVFDMLNDIGATSGMNTKYLCFELDFSTPIAHSYPVSKEEAGAIMQGKRIPALDDLQGFDSKRPSWGEKPCRPFGALKWGANAN